jgi:carbamoyl-phosphate synthase small subunit
MVTRVHDDGLAVLMLEDGSCYVGNSCGVSGEVVGELSFNTVMIGYPEVISDPANAGLIMAITYPQVGNYGIARDDLEGDSVALRALVVRDICDTPSNYRLDLSLPDFLREQSIVAVSGIDTRELTSHLRDHGVQKAIVSTIDRDPESLLAKITAAPGISAESLVASISCKKSYLFEMNNAHRAWYAPLPEPRFKVIAYDLGITRTTLNNLVRLGCAVIVVPWDTEAEEVRAYQPDGVVFSSGPGDPRVLIPTIMAATELMGQLPLFGLGIGHQVLALAAGGIVQKQIVGHRGSNYPVIDRRADRVRITTQNHGFTVDFASLGESGEVLTQPDNLQTIQNTRFGRIALSEQNLNDGTVEGLDYLDSQAVSVQYHPEFAPQSAGGKTGDDNAYAAFRALMRQRTESESGYAQTN